MYLEDILSQIVPTIIHIMEAMGVFIITFGALRAFSKYAFRLFDFSNDNIKFVLF